MHRLPCSYEIIVVYDAMRWDSIRIDKNWKPKKNCNYESFRHPYLSISQKDYILGNFKPKFLDYCSKWSKKQCKFYFYCHKSMDPQIFVIYWYHYKSTLTDTLRRAPIIIFKGHFSWPYYYIWCIPWYLCIQFVDLWVMGVLLLRTPGLL